MTHRSLARALMPVVLLCTAGTCGSAQEIPKSQLGSVTQMVDGARIEIIYRRPVARGRELFGSLVPWGRMWTPSADTAAIFRVSAPIRIEGATLPAGTYSLWTIPQPDTWTIIFSSVSPVFHLRYPEGHDVLRVHVRPTHGEHMETLAFYFPLVDADSAVLNLHWGATIVPLAIQAVDH